MKCHYYPEGLSDGAGGLAAFVVLEGMVPPYFGFATATIFHAVSNTPPHSLMVLDIPPGNTYP